MISNSAPRLGFQCRLAAIQHEDGIERRRIERGRNPAYHGHNSLERRILQRHVLMQGNSHEDGRVAAHSRRVTSVTDAVSVFVVAPVMDEERIVPILAEPFPCVGRGHSSGFAAVAGQARAAVAAERLALEEALTLAPVAVVVVLRVTLNLRLKRRHRCQPAIDPLVEPVLQMASFRTVMGRNADKPKEQHPREQDPHARQSHSSHPAPPQLGSIRPLLSWILPISLNRRDPLGRQSRPSINRQASRSHGPPIDIR